MSEYIIKAADWAIDYKGESLFKGCEEIVRCRDCKHLISYPDAKYCAGLSSAFFEVSDEDFCAWAVRRDA